MPGKTASSGRPTTFSRDDAIDRAMHLFWRDGYLAVTARDLAKAMNIQRSSFYNTFGSKEAVFAEALELYAGQAPDAALDNVRGDDRVIPAIVGALRELCRVRSADAEARGCLICNSVAELVGVDDELGPTVQRAVSRRIEVLREIFSQAERQGEFVPRIANAELANSFMTFLLGINLVSKTIRSEADLWSICRTFLLGIGLDERDLAA